SIFLLRACGTRITEQISDCGLRIADCGFINCERRAAEGGIGGARKRQSAIRDPQSAIGYLLAAAGLIWVFALLTLPLLVLGFAAMSASGTSLLKIRREAQSLAGRRARSGRSEMKSQSCS